ncbi:aldehyde dehydrogenase family protein [[Clostridium] colinum]|uniref:aldehyde dehydrogenase family protein n=1 Tax=[Clostridium] colinum TaxID=36835 RepID=UPI0020244D20|nr:aldehyde dehydrogenase family protein [[Clostridium] colinum]
MYKNIIKSKKDFFKTNITKNINFRIQMLKNLKKSIIKYENDIIMALKKDLNRSEFDSYTAEILPILHEIDYFLKNTKKLSKKIVKKTPKMCLGYKSYEIKDPYGICLIISPWNYPFLLALSPLVGAISAGNCAIIKPSEYSQNSSNILKKIIEDTFDDNYCQVVLGEADVVENIIENNIDFIFFTGSTNIGKIIMKNAAKTLTPVALELGGKSPCIIDKNIDLDKTAKRIVWGKTLNAGQTCIAPDYLLVHNDIKDKLIEKIIFYTKKFLGNEPLKNAQYSKIINEKNFNRILNLIKDTNIIYGGKYDEKTLKIEPTYVDNVSIKQNIMKEEIFGPILPIISYNNLKEVYNIVEYNKNPLAMYIFSKNKKFVNILIENIPCGNICINDTILQVSNHNIPFGGRGNSGIGVYHGKYSFELFSHKKGVLKATNLYDLNIRYNNNLSLLKKLLK